MKTFNHMNELKLYLIHYSLVHKLLQHFLLQVHDHVQYHHSPHFPQMKKEHSLIFPIRQAQKHKY